MSEVMQIPRHVINAFFAYKIQILGLDWNRIVQWIMSINPSDATLLKIIIIKSMINIIISNL